MAVDYQSFLERKSLVVPAAGREVTLDEVNPILFPWQRQLVVWAVRKGRCGLFASTGLGKSFLQIEWARLTGERTLILAPLAVAGQTIREGEKLGVPITYARRQEDAAPEGLTITNYELLRHFDPDQFGAVVLDEGSILKHHEAKTRTALIEAFRHTPYRLVATATPAPNDQEELSNHAEFLGILTRQEFLSAWFVNDHERGWRLKKHAREPFWRWLASWAMTLSLPSDIGGDDTGYRLPPLTIKPQFLPTDYVPPGKLFADRLEGVTERAIVRRETVRQRVDAAVELMRAEPEEPWLCWYGLLAEGRMLAASWGEDGVMVEGSLSLEEKERRILRFLNGEARCLITHPAIAGFGLNLQHCARMAFIGLGDSWEMYYQCLRRCWRFGQAREVVAHIVLTEPEQVIFDNILAKERQAQEMGRELLRHVREYEQAELQSVRQRSEYQPAAEMRLPAWLNGAGLPDAAAASADRSEQ